MPTKTLKKPTPAPENLSPEYLATLKWQTPRQACAYLQIARCTLQLLQDENAIPFSQPTPRVVRFDRAALDKWMAEQTNGASS